MNRVEHKSFFVTDRNQVEKIRKWCLTATSTSHTSVFICLWRTALEVYLWKEGRGGGLVISYAKFIKTYSRSLLFYVTCSTNLKKYCQSQSHSRYSVILDFSIKSNENMYGSLLHIAETKRIHAPIHSHNGNTEQCISLFFSFSLWALNNKGKRRRKESTTNEARLCLPKKKGKTAKLFLLCTIKENSFRSVFHLSFFSLFSLFEEWMKIALWFEYRFPSFYYIMKREP